jgi:hypothetical protein
LYHNHEWLWQKSEQQVKKNHYSENSSQVSL